MDKVLRVVLICIVFVINISIVGFRAELVIDCSMSGLFNC